jgi:hypothetical protein
MLTFDRESHTYQWNGQAVVNVTRVTDSLDSYFGVPANVLERKADIGDAVHYACELFDQGELDTDSLPEEIRGYVTAWIDLRATTGFVPSHVEQRVFSRRYKFAGTLDRVGYFSALKRVKPGDLCLLDIKTTATLMPAAGPQTAAYAGAFEEMNGIKIKRRYVAQLKPDGTWRLEEHEDITDFSVFLSGLSIYAWRQRHKIKEQT